jgi:elongation factor 1-gamma
MSFQIITIDKTDPRVKQVQLVAKYAGRTVTHDKGDPLNFDRWNSGQQFPALRTNEGGVWGLRNIYRHLARSTVTYPLYGENLYEHSVVDSWLDWSSTELEGPLNIICPASKIEGLEPAFLHEVFDKVKLAFDTLNKHFLTNTLLVTRRVTIADLYLVFTVLPFVTDYCDNGFRKGYPNVFRWFETITGQPAFIEVIGQITYTCAKNPLPPAPKKQAQPKKQGGGKKKEKKKEKKEEMMIKKLKWKKLEKN